MIADEPVTRPARRTALRALFTVAVAALTGGALARIASTPAAPRRPVGGAEEASRAGGFAESLAFDEMYRGRHIQARRIPRNGPVEVLVDGRPLHLMRRADGSYLSAVDHYESCTTPLAATRTAVDQSGTAPLSRYAATHGTHPGGRESA
ncbi:tyrosinase family oxidase copper chaperone [Streptomyces sp. NBC_01216]|uniref:tyrosinase family oxidase copper chaperone n=1 Tax=unclassified Streptomyces TaxID=2593676 RepID=UPI002E0ECB0D|nr:tyrosinase cofactor [Streptomyces sp. NBC_01216]